MVAKETAVARVAEDSVLAAVELADMEVSDTQNITSLHN